MKKPYPDMHRPNRLWPARWSALAAAAFSLSMGASAQTLLTENFTGGASTAGFTVTQGAGSCTWTFNNPGGQSFTGAGFDADFAIFDSDKCGSGSGMADAYLVSPAFDASSAGAIVLKFSQAYRDLDNTIAAVEVWNGSAWTQVYSPVGGNVGFPDPAAWASIDITAASGGSGEAKVRFHFGGSWVWYWALDNISVEGMDCIYPSGLAVQDLTTSGANLSWTDNGSTSYAWAVTTGAQPDGSNAVASGNGDNMAATGLEPNTAYTAYVRSECASGSFSGWSLGVPFMTPCVALPVPYLENFGEVTVPALPNCMSHETNLGPTWETTEYPAEGMTGNAALCYGYYETTDSWLFTAGLSLTGGTSYRLSYKYSNQYNFYTDALRVAYGNNTTGTAMENVLADHPAVNDGNIHQDVLDFTPATSGVYYIGFQKYSNDDTEDSYMYIDDIKVVVTPTCEEPSNVAITGMTINTAELSWDASISTPGNGYQWEVRTGGAPGSGNTGLAASGTTPAGVLAASATGLEPNTAYSLYLRSDCGNGDLGYWTDPIPFITPCIASDIPYLEDFNGQEPPALPNCMSHETNSGPTWETTEYPADGMTGNAAWCYGYDETINSWLFTAGLNLTGGTSYRLSYKYSNQYNFYTDALLVAWGSNPVGNAMTHVLIDHPAIDDGGTHQDVLDFTPAASGVYYIGFQKYSNGGTDNAYMYIDDIKVTVTPTCEEPTELALEDLTPHTADISWVASITGASGYEWELRTAGEPGSGSTGLTDSGTTGPDDTFLPLAGLEPNTTYRFYLRTDCGGGDLSFWAEQPVSFQTLCLSTDVPYTEDFESVATPNIPNCMSQQTISGNPWTTGEGMDGMTGNAAMIHWTASGSPDMNSWLFTQGLNLTGGVTYRLSYQYGNGSSYTEAMSVSFGTGANEAGMSTELADHTAINDEVLHENTADFTPAADGVYYIGFKCHSIADQYYLYLDNIHVYELQDCAGTPDPGATTGPATACADVPFTLSIANDPGNTAGYTYQWETSADNGTWTNAPGAGTAATYSASQTAATWYRVQMTCANGGTAASTPLLVGMNAPTTCYCTSINFTSTVEPICNVTFAGINHDSPGDVGGSPVLEDFTAFTAQVQQGGSYTISVTGNTAGSYTCYFTAFFDWNGDGTLETAVAIGSINSDVCTQAATATVDVPADAVIGAARMRVVKNFNESPADPCAEYSYGQAEDYTVEVSPAAEVEDCLGVEGGTALPGTPCTGTNGYGGLWSNSCVCIENVGIEETAAAAGIAVHPNPASTELFITTPDGRPVHAKVFDMVGKLALEKHQTTRMDVANLAPGSYSLLIMDAQGNIQARTRFVKH